MTRASTPSATIVAFALASAAASLHASDATSQWPQWRGPLATGEAPAADPPVRWSESENVRWKVPIPGRGQASPVVWGDKVFVLTSIPADGDLDAREPKGPVAFEVLALDRATGETVWRRTAAESVPHEGTHSNGSWAAGSPVTDGRRLFAFFGSHGLYAYDLEGKLLWTKDLGDMTTRRGFGEGSSPALSGETIVVNWDHEGDSFIVALNAGNGEERWRAPRDEVTSWATPIVVPHQGRRQVIVNATERIRGYDLATGELLWSTGGMTTNTIPSPVHDDGVVYATSGFRGNALKAIRLAAAKGDFSAGEAIVWEHDRDTPYVPSPLLYDGALYVLKSSSGILTVFDAASGERLYGPERLPDLDGVYASPVAAAGRVYVAGRDGAIVVLAAGPKLDVLAVNELDDGFDATPALVGSEIFLRGNRSLYCIAEDGSEEMTSTSSAAQEATSSAARAPAP